MNIQRQLRLSYGVLLALTGLAASILPVNADNLDAWGAATNGVRAGLWYRTVTNGASIGIIPELKYGDTTNKPSKSVVLFLPPERSRYKMTLFDEHGMPVLKTKAGKALGVPIEAKLHTINWEHGYVDFDLKRGYAEPTGDGPLLLSNYFQITNSGRYRLELQIGIVWYVPLMQRDAVPQFLFLPPVDAEINIKMK